MSETWLLSPRFSLSVEELEQWSSESSKNPDPFEDSDIWKKANRLVSSGEGSTGVFILKTADASVVLKSAPSIGQEYFSSVLAQVIRKKCSLSDELLDFPKMRIFGFSESNEWCLVKEKLSQLAIGSPGLHIKVEKELNRPFFLVQQFVEGQDLASMGAERLNILLTPSESIPTKPLRQLGWIMAFDMLINNFDRLPLIWDNDGNLPNIFLRHEVGNRPKIVGIDQAVTTIDPSVSPKGVQNYLTKLEQFIDPLIESPMMLQTRLLKVQDSLLMWSGFQLSHDQILALQFFLLEAICCYGKSLTSETLSTVKSFVQTRISYDWQNIWGAMMKLINLDFLGQVLAIFQTRSDKIERILSNYQFPFYPSCCCSSCSSKK